MRKFHISIVGFGYWGPNLARNFGNLDDVSVKYICDVSPSALTRAKRVFKNAECVADFRVAIKDTQIDAVAIATPVSSHFEIAKLALEEGKHIFVEKPLTLNSDQAKELIDLAAKKNLQIMVDHTFLFSGPIKKMKSLVDDQALGDLLYYDSTRVNLGLFQQDVNVIWDLAPHDFSIMNYLLDHKPIAVTATGFDHFNRNLVNTAFVTVYFASLIAHFNVNWLSPVKVRKTLLGGSKKMLIWDDLSADEKLRIYDKGVEIITSSEDIRQLKFEYRFGDAHLPKIDPAEPLQFCVKHFLDCIEGKTTPIASGEEGLKVVRLLEASNQSLKNKGREILL